MKIVIVWKYFLDSHNIAHKIRPGWKLFAVTRLNHTELSPEVKSSRGEISLRVERVTTYKSFIIGRGNFTPGWNLTCDGPHRRPLALSYSSKKVLMIGSHLCQNPKNLVFAPFLGLLGPSWPAGTYAQKSDLVTFLTLWLSNLLKRPPLPLKKTQQNSDERIPSS